MKPEIEIELVERTKSINWFVNVGKGTIAGCQRVKTWEQALKALDRQSSDHAWIDSFNGISNTFSNVSQQDWNVFSRRADKLVDKYESLASRLTKKARNCRSIPKEARDAFFGLFESSFAISLSKEIARQEFFPDIEIKPHLYLKYLEFCFDGHCLCGYSGKYPNGKMIVF